MLAVETVNLGKTFTTYGSFLSRIKNRGKSVEALKDVNMQIKEREIFGLLGPNGAGKTTLINILSTLLLPDHGTAKIFGLDVVEDPKEVRKIISLSSAYTELYDELTVKENLEIYAKIAGLNTDVNRFISLVEMEEYSNKPFDDISSGNKQKALIARSLMSNPKLLLLDELTVALDPAVALKMRKLIRDWRDKNRTTIILTTHNMYEAEELCDRVAIVNKGRIVACNTPKKLKKAAKDGDYIEVLTDRPVKASVPLKKIGGVKDVALKDSQIVVHVDEAEKRLEKIIELLLSKNYKIKAIEVREPTLEDVFIKLTGERLE